MNIGNFEQQIKKANDLLALTKEKMSGHLVADFQARFKELLSQKKKLAVLRAEMALSQLEQGSKEVSDDIKSLQTKLEMCFTAIREMTREAVSKNIWAPIA